MSLNGLDSLDIVDAYRAALAQSCGWLLLKYTSRDAVGLLARSSDQDHGELVSQIQEILAGQAEKSPVYGFLHHDGQKLLLKYIPNGTSRLLIGKR